MNIGKITENRIFYICSSITQSRAFLVKKKHAEISMRFQETIEVDGFQQHDYEKDLDYRLLVYMTTLAYH